MTNDNIKQELVELVCGDSNALGIGPFSPEVKVLTGRERRRAIRKSNREDKKRNKQKGFTFISDTL